MMDEDVKALAGRRYGYCADRPGYRWGRTRAQVGFHGDRIDVDRPRVRHKATGREMALPSWEEISSGGFFDRWAVNLMVMNMATRGFRRAVRLLEAGVQAGAGSGLSRSAVSRRFKALTQAKLEREMPTNLHARRSERPSSSTSVRAAERRRAGVRSYCQETLQARVVQHRIRRETLQRGKDPRHSHWRRTPGGSRRWTPRVT